MPEQENTLERRRKFRITCLVWSWAKWDAEVSVTLYLLWEDICKAFYRNKPICKIEKQKFSSEETLLQIICTEMIASATIDSAVNWRNCLKVKVKSKGDKNKALRNNLFPPQIIGESRNWKYSIS